MLLMGGDQGEDSEFEDISKVKEKAIKALGELEGCNGEAENH